MRCGPQHRRRAGQKRKSRPAVQESDEEEFIAESEEGDEEAYEEEEEDEEEDDDENQEVELEEEEEQEDEVEEFAANSRPKSRSRPRQPKSTTANAWNTGPSVFEAKSGRKSTTSMSATEKRLNLENIRGRDHRKPVRCSMTWWPTRRTGGTRWASNWPKWHATCEGNRVTTRYHVLGRGPLMALDMINHTLKREFGSLGTSTQRQ